ncbi:MAG TPA: NAD-binding protein [Candidatus Limnocylindrales bacterium]|nr:NAD-binding protein [Candidatus Limnocylindrales bacterium]
MKLGLSNGADNDDPADATAESAIVFLGCFREASSILHEIEVGANKTDGGGILGEVLVIDFNPQVLHELKLRQIKCLYGDIAHMDTLHHAHIQSARIVACTISDAILRGTSNLRLLQQARRLSPHARVIAAADAISSAVELYDQGADFVYIARLHSAHHMAELITRAVMDGEGFKLYCEQEVQSLKQRMEVLPQ